MGPPPRLRIAVPSGELCSPGPSVAASTGPDHDPPARGSRGDASCALHHLSTHLWNNRDLSDVTVRAVGREFHLHQLLLCRVPKFGRLLQEGRGRGEWPVVIDFPVADPFVTPDGFEAALGHLYGRLIPERLGPKEAMGLLSSAWCLDIVDLCEACLDAVASSLSPETFADYYRFAREWRAGGPLAQRLQELTWNFLCSTADAELRYQVPELPLEVVGKLMASDELWVNGGPWKRFRLAVHGAGGRLEEARGAVERAVVQDVLQGAVDDVADGVADEAALVPEEGGWVSGRKGHKRARPEAGIDPGRKRRRLRWGEGAASGACVASSCAARPAMDSWESYGSPFGEGSDVSRSVKCEQSEIAGRSAGRAGARGEGRQACEEAVREAARVEASVWRLLGGGGGGHYDGMDFWELQRVGETFRELDLPDNERALQQALWRREALHSMVVAAARQGDGLGPSDGSQCAGSLGLPPCNANCSPPCRFLGMPEVPQLRYGFEFADVESLGDHRKSPLSSKQVFFAGSLFKVMLSVATKKASNQKMLGIFFHRDSSFKGRLGDANGFVDPRAKIDVSITIIVGNAEQEGIGLKGSLQSPRSNLGYSTLLPFGDLRRYLSPSGTLRVSVILSHLFDTADKPDGSHTSTPRIV